MATNFIFGLSIHLDKFLLMVSGDLGHFNNETILHHVPHLIINSSETDLHLLLLEGIVHPIEDGDLEV
jgi:hypothetical protein